jgi:hypothetical protein
MKRKKQISVKDQNQNLKKTKANPKLNLRLVFKEKIILRNLKKPISLGKMHTENSPKIVMKNQI